MASDKTNVTVQSWLLLWPVIKNHGIVQLIDISWLIKPACDTEGGAAVPQEHPDWLSEQGVVLQKPAYDIASNSRLSSLCLSFFREMCVLSVPSSDV